LERYPNYKHGYEMLEDLFTDRFKVEDELKQTIVFGEDRILAKDKGNKLAQGALDFLKKRLSESK
jgi:hypothetical protein